jgi:hypothetical protein
MSFGQRKRKMSEYRIMLSAILFTQSQFDREGAEIRKKEMLVLQILRKVPTLPALSTLSKSAIGNRVRYICLFKIIT